MDQQTLNNWKKIKETLEASGKTNTYLYKRAIAILANKTDLLACQSL
jgi:hypothetical protein